MTNEEVIGVLEDIRDAICDSIPGNHAELDELREAVRIATEALRERKTGKWIDETFKPWGLVHHPYKCNQCGENSEADSDFCPNCGADMRGETDG